MRDDVEQLLVRPYVMLMRRDVEIADQNVPRIALRMQRFAIALFIEKRELVLEFRIGDEIGNVAAGRHVEIMQHQWCGQARAFAERDRDMAGIDLAAERAHVLRSERPLRDNGDAVVTLLPVQRDVLVTEPLKTFQRKSIVDALGLLQAQNVSAPALEKLGDQINAQANGIDIPGGEREGHVTMREGEGRLIAQPERDV